MAVTTDDASSMQNYAASFDPVLPAVQPTSAESADLGKGDEQIGIDGTRR